MGAPSTGLYVVLEGIDGSGKDTQASRLVARLATAGRRAIIVREPSDGNPVGRLLRGFLDRHEHSEAHSALFLADRLITQQDLHAPARAAGEIVVSVRSFFSTLVYQQDQHPFEQLVRTHVWSAILPDVLIWLDLDAKAAFARKGYHRDLYTNAACLARYRRRYFELVDGACSFGWIALGGSTHFVNAELPVDAVADAVYTIVQEALTRREEPK